jgi:O-antigen/teichoic acid export membrane protein
LLGRLARGTGVNLAGDIIGKLLGLGFIGLIARFLTDQELGRYFLGLTAIRFLNIGSLLGLEQGLRRFVARFNATGDTLRVRGTVRSATVVAVSFSVTLACILFFGADAVAQTFLRKPEMAQTLRWYALGLPPLTFSSLMIAASQGLQVMRLKVYVRNLMEPTLRAIVAGTFFFLGMPLFGAVGSQVVALFVAAGLSYWLLGRLLARPITGPAALPGRELLLFSLPLSLSAFIAYLLGWMDTLMLGVLAPIETVGSYNLANRVVVSATLFLAATNGMFGPMIAQLYAENRQRELESVFKTATKWVIIATLPAYVLMILFPEVILTFFGRAHEGAATCLAILAAGHIVHAGTGSVGQMNTMAGRSYLVFFNNVATLLVNLPLNLLWIPRYGASGAATATAISLVAINLLRIAELWYFDRIHAYRWSHIKPLLAVGAASAVAVAMCKLLPVLEANLVIFLVLATVFFAAYAVVLYSLGLEADDQWVVERLRGRLRRKPRAAR